MLSEKKYQERYGRLQQMLEDVDQKFLRGRTGTFDVLFDVYMDRYFNLRSFMVSQLGMSAGEVLQREHDTWKGVSAAS
jgi:hypothetical protein